MKFGVDIVMHSLTKYMNGKYALFNPMQYEWIILKGHSDVLMGAAVMNSPILYESLRQQQLMVGAVPSPFDCYLALRGLRTLYVRMNQHQESGLAVALYLKDHPKIEKVLHPG